MQPNDNEDIDPMDDPDYQGPTLEDDMCYINDIMRCILSTHIDTDS